MNIDVNIIKLNPNAILPSYATDCAAGADLYACLDCDSVIIQPNQTQFIRTGIALELPQGTVGLIYARSGLACKSGLAPANKVGVIDSDYRGEIIVALHNHSQEPKIVENYTRIAQLVITPYLHATFSVNNTISTTSRGDGGFGSTGTK